MRHDTLISTMWLQKYRAQKNYYLSWVAWNWVINMWFFSPKEGKWTQFFSLIFTQPMASNYFGPSIYSVKKPWNIWRLRINSQYKNYPIYPFLYSFIISVRTWIIWLLPRNFFGWGQLLPYLILESFIEIVPAISESISALPQDFSCSWPPLTMPQSGLDCPNLPEVP